MEINYPEYLKEFLDKPVAFKSTSGVTHTKSCVAPEVCLRAYTGGGAYNNPVGALLTADEFNCEKVLFVWLVQVAGRVSDFKSDPKMFLGRYWALKIEIGKAPEREYTERNNLWPIGYVIRKDKSFATICYDYEGKIFVVSDESRLGAFSYRKLPSSNISWIKHTHARSMGLASISDARKSLKESKATHFSYDKLSDKTRSEILNVFPDFEGSSMFDFSMFLLQRIKKLSDESVKKAQDRKDSYAKLIQDSMQSDEFIALSRVVARQERTYWGTGILYRYDGKLIYTSINSDGRPYQYAQWHIFDGTKHVCIDSQGNPKVARYDGSYIISTKDTVDSTPLKKLKDAGIDVFFHNSLVPPIGSTWDRREIPARILKSNKDVCVFDTDAIRILRHEKMVEQLINMGCKNLASLALTEPTLISKRIYTKFTALTKACGYTAKQLKIIDGHVHNINMGAHGFRPDISYALKELLRMLDEGIGVSKKDIDINTFENILRLECLASWILNLMLSELEISNVGSGLYDRLKKLTAYLPERRGDEAQDGSSIELLSDYLMMRRRFLEADNSIPVLPPPKKIREYHDELVTRQAQLEMRINAQHSQKLNEKYAPVYKKAVQFEYEDGPYCIVCPKGLEELVFEGNVLNHCVGGYQESVANGNEYILFMRRSNKKEVPWYTIDILPNGKVRQIHTKRNRCIKEDPEAASIMAFLRKWCENTGAIESSLGNINGALCAVH